MTRAAFAVTGALVLAAAIAAAQEPAPAVEEPPPAAPAKHRVSDPLAEAQTQPAASEVAEPTKDIFDVIRELAQQAASAAPGA